MSIEVGQTVTGIPVGQKRRQEFKVTDIKDGVVVGLLVSKKYPGDFRGHVVAFEETVEPKAGC